MGYRPGFLWSGLVDRLAIGVLVAFGVIALVGPVVVPGDPSRVDLTQTFQGPIWESGNLRHIFGTDQLGREISVRLVYGSRISLAVAFAAISAACLVGVILGMVAGFYGEWPDVVISRLIDGQLSLPSVILALVLVTVLGPSVPAVVAVIAASAWVSFARVIRAEVLVLRESDFVALARVAALPDWQILYRHLLPNVTPSILVLLSIDFGRAIIMEASLSFLGLGVQPPATSWGLMIAETRSFIQTAPWAVLVPAFALALLALSANVFGDYVRDRLDPTLSVVD